MSTAIVEHCEGVVLAQDVRFWRAAARVALEPKERRYRLRQARKAQLQLHALAKQIEERAAREGGVAYDPARSENFRRS